MPLLTADNLPEVLAAIGAIIAAVGGVTLWRVQKEPPKPGTADAATVALAENTKALQAMAEALDGQNGHFADNNQMFRALGPVLATLASDMATIKHDIGEAKGHLASIRDSLNRRG